MKKAAKADSANKLTKAVMARGAIEGAGRVGITINVNSYSDSRSTSKFAKGREDRGTIEPLGAW